MSVCSNLRRRSSSCIEPRTMRVKVSTKEWFGMKKRQRRKTADQSDETNRKKQSKRMAPTPRVQTKNFDIFVTDFLTDPCGLPVELRDYVLVDGTTPLNDGSGSILDRPSTRHHLRFVRSMLTEQ